VTIVVGVLLGLVGAAFASSGAYRLLRPRRREDVEWIRANPMADRMLGGWPLGFDRVGALASVVVGGLAVVLGTGVLLA
jgi:hypothetical protein